MKIAIFGIQGQLGRDVESALSDHDVVPMYMEDVDIRDRSAVGQAVAAASPNWVVNCAAMTHVDNCETQAQDAFAVNALGAWHAALAARAASARLIHISTDYVFDGRLGRPYVETDPPRPINVYGASKLAGEYLVDQAYPQSVILRTSGLYGLHECWGKGTNFVETMLRLGRERASLEVVEDEFLTPTFTQDLAALIASAVETPLPGGIYHATNEGRCSWMEFAKEIFEIAEIRAAVEGIKATDWGAPARRPADSTLDNAALTTAGRNAFPHWRDALGRYLTLRSAGGAEIE